MPSPKQEFLRSKDDVAMALQIVKGDTFQKLLIYAKAQFAMGCPTKEALEGVNAFERILIGLPEAGEEMPGVPPAGLQHDLSIPDRPFTTEPKPATQS